MKFKTKRTPIRGFYINGLKDRKLAERLQLMENLTLQAAVTFLISSETVKRQDNAIHKSEKEEIAVEHVRKGRGGRATYHGRGGSREETRSVRERENRSDRGHDDRENRSYRGRGDREYREKCAKCGYDYHDYDYCPAENQRCNYCDKKDHFARVCGENHYKNNRRVNPVEASESGEDGSFMVESDDDINEILGEVSINTINVDRKWMIRAQISKCEGGQKSIDFKLDTGASVSCLPSRLFRKNCKYLKKPKLKLLTADKKLVQTRGVVSLEVEYDGKKGEESGQYQP